VTLGLFLGDVCAPAVLPQKMIPIAPGRRVGFLFAVTNRRQNIIVCFSIFSAGWAPVVVVVVVVAGRWRLALGAVWFCSMLLFLPNLCRPVSRSQNENERHQGIDIAI
jgi:hypothetical protein